MKWKHVKWCEEVKKVPSNIYEISRIDTFSPGLRDRILALFYRAKVRLEMGKILLHHKEMFGPHIIIRYIATEDRNSFKFHAEIWDTSQPELKGGISIRLYYYI